MLLDTIADPGPLVAGKAYQLDLPAPRHRHLQDFRVLVIDTDPVMPTIRSCVARSKNSP